MAVRIYPLGGVPQEEAEGVRAALAWAGIEFYETPASTPGIGDTFIWSQPEAIWVSRDADAPAALAVIDRYHMQPRRQHAPAQLNVAPAPFRRKSSTPRFMLILIGIVLVLLLLGGVLGTWLVVT
jgi:hypothetical protein